MFDGVNAIETAFRNAALLPEAHKSESRTLLREYVEIRLEMPKSAHPLLVWAVLMIVTILSTLGVGFQFGLAGNRSPMANVMLALTFALVMTLIFDLEQPGKGLIDVNQQPMYDLYERLRKQE